ncbi:leucine Rich repeat-containing domain protein [Teladorsagia circumcincta]|uniref:Leucine Rich repeat-containing domain protein n=1 Tax=Teladorsagia circumcincta TaxID=45464 RepID=A0A2G9TVH7_TELCI|nr:leucine Rich repeat-containing domain protein [Teladorsagia circumcincta]
MITRSTCRHEASPLCQNHCHRLELGSNLLDHLPDNIGALVHLEHLDLYNNQIEELPLSFSNLNALRWLDLKRNPLNPELLKVAYASQHSAWYSMTGTVVIHQAFQVTGPINVNNKAKFSQAREPKKEKESPKPVRTNRGFFSTKALQAFYHRVEVFVSNWSSRGLAKAIEAGF